MTRAKAFAVPLRYLAPVSAALLLILGIWTSLPPGSAAAADRPPYQLALYDNAAFMDLDTPEPQRAFWLDRADEGGTGLIRLDLIWRNALVDESVAPTAPPQPPTRMV